MSIRVKLILPLILLIFLLGVILNFYWIPNYKSNLMITMSEKEKDYIEILSTSLTPAILSSDLAQIHATLNSVLDKRKNWNYIELRNSDGQILYPLEFKINKNGLDEFAFKIILEEPIAKLSVYLSMENVIQSEMEEINRLGFSIILTISFVTLLIAFLLDKAITRRVNALAKASLRLSDGDFETALPSRTNDEIGALIDAYEKMKTNINVRQIELKRQNNLLSLIGQVVSLYISDIEPRKLFEILLSELIEYTESKFGFIGIVQTRQDNSQYLKVLALTNISWSKETEELYKKNQENGMEFNNLNSLFGAAITSKKIIISNEPATDARSCGVPDGHPKLQSFLGVPLKRNGDVIAMFGLANKENGYDQQLIDSIQPLINVCTYIIESYLNNQQRILAENAVKERELRMSTIMESIVDAIFTTDDRGVIETYNRAASEIFGFNDGELIGKNISILVPDNHKSRHDEYIQNYHQGKESQIIGVGREVNGVSKDGVVIPLEVAITKMKIGGRLLFCVAARDISERKRIEKMKSEFVANVSHELRTPLTSIRGALGLLSSGRIVELPEDAKKLMNIAGNNTERLLMLINDLLDIEKIESGQMKFENAPTSVSELITRSIEDNKAYADQFHVSIKVVGEIVDVNVYADKNRLMQVMSNLISNAAKFSPPGATIDISMETVKDHIKIAVADHGCGIPENFKEKLFEKFTQSDASSTRKVGGTGLGLSISKAIVEKQNGKLTYISAENIGTTFFIDLPISKPEALTNENHTLVRDNKGKRILVVEDDEDTAIFIKTVFVESGYSVDIAHNIKQAKQFININKYFLITLDSVLPDQVELSGMSEIIKQSVNSETNLVIISANAENKYDSNYRNCPNIIEIIQKPIDYEKLIQTTNGRQ